MTRRIKKQFYSCIFLMGLLWLCGCSSSSHDSEKVSKQEKQQGLEYEKSIDLTYAKNFNVDYYKGGYVKLTTNVDGNQLLIVPEGKTVPEGLDEKIKVINRPVSNVYLVSSAVMDLVAAVDGIDAVTLSALQAKDWYVEEASHAMESGKMFYAGKYNKPDYELIVEKNCSLTIENSMINHSPEVIDKIEELGIPVMIEYSSYESHPLGRVEWIKFFGALLGKEDKAEEIFKKECNGLEEIKGKENTGKTVAFFYITANGKVQVRQSSDYIPKMIELAGGSYIFKELGDPDSKRATINITMEQFYQEAKNADYIIYNSSIDGGIKSIKELTDKSELLKDFKAVQNNNVWCTTSNTYQQSLSIGYLIQDMHSMLTQNGKKTSYLYHVD